MEMKECGLKGNPIVQCERSVLRWFGHVERISVDLVTRIYEGRTMKMLVVLLMVMSSVLSYDMPDPDNLLFDEKSVTQYVNCLLEKDICPPGIQEFKDDIPEELKTSCETCAPSKRKFIRKTSTYLMKERPEVWKKIVERYDATGKYMDNFLKFLKSDD
uniref:Chemosensory protein n=1 Tax=Timema bartmani TaxID=61472 RepID=A0A7R9I423_9NEOP|nr:unnamed protein product [Timema bartmani]